MSAPWIQPMWCKKPSKVSKAIPIMKPSSDSSPQCQQQVSPDSESADTLSPRHKAAIEQAATALTTLAITGQDKDKYDDTRPRSEKDGTKEENIMPTTVVAIRMVDDEEEEVEKGFNIYAKPFVPEVFTIINTLQGFLVDTPPVKSINFSHYIHQSLPPAFLPQILHQRQPAATSFSETTSIIPKFYEEFFQYHLHDERKAQQQENDSYSLFGHSVIIKAVPDGPSQQGQPPHIHGAAICIVHVPGLRENSPYVEEDDIVQLRQLRRGIDGNLDMMVPWLAMYKGRMDGPKAPGWTGTIHNARVLSVVRAEETLVLRVLGLATAPLPRDMTFNFNIQFPLPPERHLPMFHALPLVQEALMPAHSHESRQPQERLHWLHSMLFPTNQDCEVQNTLHPGAFGPVFFDDEINWEQKRAVESICSRNYGTLPFLISGPPGTGKTRTLIETAVQLVRRVGGCHHILICAPSDPAADTLAQRLGVYLGPAEMLRLNKPSRTFAEVPDTLLRYCYVDQDRFWLPPFRQLMQYRVVVTTCRDASMLMWGRVSSRDLFVVEQVSKFRLYLSLPMTSEVHVATSSRGDWCCGPLLTLWLLQGIASSIHPFDQPPQQRPLHWSALLIDEAAQATEPEALVPLAVVAPPLFSDMHNSALTTSPLVIMAGDEHQLGPRTSHPTSPLKKSLFARLFARPVYAEHPLARQNTANPPPLTRSLLPIFRPAFTNLIRNYRSHPAILAVPSNLFYADTLLPEAADTNRLSTWAGWKGRRWPVLFHNNPSRDELERLDGCGGWYNAGEAQIACRYAADLVGSGLVAQEEVCIMSPFKAQVRYLRKLIRRREYGALWGVNIGPTEAFQGLERGVVILCVTRARERFVQEDQKLGWGVVGTPNRMNVALTRAKFGLVVIGRRQLLVGTDRHWKSFVGFCERNGLVGGAGAEQEGGVSLHPPPAAADGGGQQKVTRLEKVLLDKELDMMDPRMSKWGVMSAGQEMWMNGQMVLPSEPEPEPEHEDDDEYDADET